MKLTPVKKRLLGALNHNNVSYMFRFSFFPHFLSANAVNNSMFLSKRLTINEGYLETVP